MDQICSDQCPFEVIKGGSFLSLIRQGVVIT
jgi:hypothetical protein